MPRVAAWRDALELRLEAERDRLPLWAPVALGGGVALWFLLPGPREWVAAIFVALAGAAGALAMARGGRAPAMLATLGLCIAAGIALVWWRAERVAAPVLARPAVVRFTARVERIERLAARDLVRVTLAPIGLGEDGRGRTQPLPPRLRVNLAEADAPQALGVGGVIRLRARLMPPPAAAVPGAYDYARVAWFAGIGATGRGFAPVETLAPGWGGAGLRSTLSTHIAGQADGSAGGIAAALATGDVGAIAEEDAEAMRAAGLAHLLSVSGLHITAVVGATMVIVLRLLALSPALALRFRLPLVAAGAGAAAAIGYTLLTGAEVPTIRSCVAALLVLAALALGREALTLRLVAAGATVVLLLWPESLAGPSFQLSFAAITAIVALHEHPRMRAFGQVREEGVARRLARGAALLLATGIVVEAALTPIAVFHFHKAGLYGALANIIAIPLTTFIIMPLEVVALLLDTVRLGAPAWWLVERAIGVLLWLAHMVARAPGAVSAWPATPAGAFALVIGGGLWLPLWRTGWRWWGVLPAAAGVIWAAMTPAPDLLVTGDGRHAALRGADGEVALLRDRTGNYMRDMLAETGGSAVPPLALSDRGDARCTADLCLAELVRDGRRWRVLMTRSQYLVPAGELITACRGADIVVSERTLPRGCRPRWLRLDRPTLQRTGGVAVTLKAARVATVRRPGDRHPWVVPHLLSEPRYIGRGMRMRGEDAK